MKAPPGSKKKKTIIYDYNKFYKIPKTIGTLYFVVCIGILYKILR